MSKSKKVSVTYHAERRFKERIGQGDVETEFRRSGPRIQQRDGTFHRVHPDGCRFVCKQLNGSRVVIITILDGRQIYLEARASRRKKRRYE